MAGASPRFSAARLRQDLTTFPATAEPGGFTHSLGVCPAPAAQPVLVGRTGSSWEQGESKGMSDPGDRKFPQLKYRRTCEARPAVLTSGCFTPFFPLDCLPHVLPSTAEAAGILTAY